MDHKTHGHPSPHTQRLSCTAPGKTDILQGCGLTLVCPTCLPPLAPQICLRGRRLLRSSARRARGTRWLRTCRGLWTRHSLPGVRCAASGARPLTCQPAADGVDPAGEWWPEPNNEGLDLFAEPGLSAPSGWEVSAKTGFAHCLVRLFVCRTSCRQGTVLI